LKYPHPRENEIAPLPQPLGSPDGSGRTRGSDRLAAAPANSLAANPASVAFCVRIQPQSVASAERGGRPRIIHRSLVGRIASAAAKIPGEDGRHGSLKSCSGSTGSRLRPRSRRARRSSRPTAPRPRPGPLGRKDPREDARAVALDRRRDHQPSPQTWYAPRLRERIPGDLVRIGWMPLQVLRIDRATVLSSGVVRHPVRI
jgi:hypothetical protein